MSNTATETYEERQIRLCNEARKANGLALLTKSQAIRHLKSFRSAVRTLK